MRGHSHSDDLRDLRDFRGRGFPRSPLLPASSLNGNEGVDGSSPSEGLKFLQIRYFCCLFRRGTEGDHGGGQRSVDLQGLLLSIGHLRGCVEGTFREHECQPRGG
jgi:hypothetical protein